MSLVILTQIIVILSGVILALFIYIQNPKSWTNKFFTILNGLLVLWSVTLYISTNPPSTESALFWIRSTISVAAPMSATFFLLVSTFPNEKVTLKRPYLIGLLALTLLTIVVSQSPFLFTSLQINGSDLQPTVGPGMSLFVLLNFGSIIGSIIILSRRFFKLKGVEKEQIRYLLLGIGLLFTLVLALIFVPAVFLGNSSLVSLGPLCILSFLLPTAYAIVRHRLLDIRLVIARAIAYGSLVAIIATFFIGSTITITSLFLDTATSVQQIVLYAALTLVVALLFQRLRRILEVATDKIFFKADYDSDQLLSELTKIMAETILIDDIAHKLLYKIIFEMRISRGSFVLTDGGQILVTETQGYKLDEQPRYSEKDIFSLQAVDKNLILEDLEEGPTKDLLRKLNVTVAIPLKTTVDHVGMLLLGEKASGEIYSEKDIRVLEIFAPEAAISFENAASVEKIRRFNITLREQVDRATKELKEANEQLKSLDKLKDEFLSIASHDLRTPMTAIKSYLWMAVNGRAGKLNPQLKHYLDVSYSSSERMITMINDLLNVSRIEAGRVQMTFEDAELKPLVDQVFAEMAAKASEKSIELKYDEEASLPHLILDKQRFPEILQNLVGNALKFTPEKGKITVSAKKSKDVGFAEIAVTDTGVGISEEDKKNLFSKYGRMEHSYSAASTTGGTGLGLYITKNYIELHGGSIWVESTLGKGTSFIFNIRITEKELLEKMNQEAQKKQIAPAIPPTK